MIRLACRVLADVLSRVPGREVDIPWKHVPAFWTYTVQPLAVALRGDHHLTSAKLLIYMVYIYSLYIYIFLYSLYSLHCFGLAWLAVKGITS